MLTSYSMEEHSDANHGGCDAVLDGCQTDKVVGDSVVNPGDAAAILMDIE